MAEFGRFGILAELGRWPPRCNCRRTRITTRPKAGEDLSWLIFKGEDNDGQIWYSVFDGSKLGARYASSERRYVGLTLGSTLGRWHFCLPPGGREQPRRLR